MTTHFELISSSEPRRIDQGVAVVIPCYNVSTRVAAVVSVIPDSVSLIVTVNDARTNDTDSVLASLARRDGRVQVTTHAANEGVGGAMASGFAYALKAGVSIVVKLDGDGQMAPQDIKLLIQPLLLGKADYVKGNRFRDIEALRQMLPVQEFGNLTLSPKEPISDELAQASPVRLEEAA